MRLTCFVDLDGVLVDFVAAAIATHKSPLKKRDVRWDVFEQLGVSEAEFWRTKNYAWWLNLEWTDEGKELLAGVESIFGPENVALMTHGRDADCVVGKIGWVARNLPEYAGRLILTRAKHMAAGPGKFLIDDHDENRMRFVLAGGVALTPPRPWNLRREECDEEGRFDVKAFLNEVREEAEK